MTVQTYAPRAKRGVVPVADRPTGAVEGGMTVSEECDCYERPCPDPHRLSVHSASQRKLGLFIALCPHECSKDVHGSAHWVPDEPKYDGRRAYRILRRLSRQTRRSFPSVGFGPFQEVIELAMTEPRGKQP